MLPSRCWLLLLALLWFGTSPVQSQTGGTPPADTKNPPERGATVFQANARTVIVDVVVTTGSGSPVSGLHKDAFHVFEKGQPQEITFFEEHTPAPKPLKPPLRQPLPTNVFSNYSSTPLPDSVNVLLLDSLNTPLQEQSFVHEQAVEYLKHLPEGTRMAIFGMSENLSFIQGFTSDPVLLMAALGDRRITGVQTSPLLKSRTEQDTDDKVISQMEEMNVSHQAASQQAAINAMRQFLAERDAFEGDQRVTGTLENLQLLARFLGGVPGRKNVIWLSGAFPLSIFPDEKLSDPSNVMRQYEDEVKKTADLLTAARVAVYPVDAYGLQTDSFFSAENARRQPALLTIEAMQRNGMHATMDELARDTGGRAFYNSNGLSSAMDTAVTNGAHFYSLAYTPPSPKMDGTFRRIQVKVAGGYKESYRRGYYAEDEKKTKAVGKGGPDDPLQPFMGFAMPNFEQIVYKVRVEPAKQPQQPGVAGRNPRLKGPTIRYSIDFAVVLKDVHLDVAADGIRRGTVNLSLRVYDRYGEALNWQSKTIAMEIKPDAYPKFLEKGLQFHDEIDAPKGAPAWLRTGIYDPATSLAGTLEIPLDAVRDVAAESAK